MLEKDIFGKNSAGETVERYTLRNARGATARIITHGATVTELHMPDRNGQMADVVLGFDDQPPYDTNDAHIGCMVGRVAFRIYRGQFRLDGRDYQLPVNAGGEHLHGGPKNFSRALWKAEPVSDGSAPAVKFSLRSPDGDQGYPGTLDASAVYTLTENNELQIDSSAVADKPTLVNLTHHSYFNLAGAAAGDILNHVVQFEADRWLPANDPNSPAGNIASVQGTPFDFSRPTAIGARIEQTGGNPTGYDHCFLRNRKGGDLARVAEVYEPASGRVMEVLTTEPAFVFYTANYQDGTLRGKGGVVYTKHIGLCLETGRPPDAIRYPNYPPIVLRPDETYRHRCIYRFSAK